LSRSLPAARLGDPEQFANNNTVVVCLWIYGESNNPLVPESSGSSSNSSWILTSLCAPTNKHSMIKIGYHQSSTPNNIILDAYSRQWSTAPGDTEVHWFPCELNFPREGQSRVFCHPCHLVSPHCARLDTMSWLPVGRAL